MSTFQQPSPATLFTDVSSAPEIAPHVAVGVASDGNGAHLPQALPPLSPSPSQLSSPSMSPAPSLSPTPFLIDYPPEPVIRAFVSSGVSSVGMGAQLPRVVSPSLSPAPFHIDSSPAPVIGALVSAGVSTPAPIYTNVRSAPSVGSDVAINISSVNGNGAGHDVLQYNRHKVQDIVRRRDLNSLRGFGGIEKVASLFSSHAETGLNGVHGRQHGSNAVQHPSFYHFMLKACNSYTIFILLFSGGLSFILGMVEEGPNYGWLDGVVILANVFVLVTVPSFVNFCQARKNTERLLKKCKLQFTVVRGGKSQHVDVTDVMEGELVHLSVGDLIVGDGLLVRGDGLVLDEVLDSRVDSIQNPFLFSGSRVIDGSGYMIVTSVNPSTACGELMAGLVTHDPDERTMLQAHIEKINTCADYIALCTSVVITFALFLRFVRTKQDGHEDQLPKLKAVSVSIQGMMKIFESISLKQGMVRTMSTSLTALLLGLGLQHLLPFVISVSLSCWKLKVMASDQVSLKNLSVCGTMGLATAACIDVSQGILCTQTEVDGVWIGNNNINDDANESHVCQAVLETLRLALEKLGSPMDGLFISWLGSKYGKNLNLPTESFSIPGSRKYSSFNNKVEEVQVRMKRDGVEKILVLRRGDARAILDCCSHYSDFEGNNHAMGNQKKNFEQVIKDMEERGTSSLVAFAYNQTDDQDFREYGLNLLALVGFKKNPNREAVEALKKAGVIIKLVSRDEVEVVRAVANNLGIITASDEVVDGEAFQKLGADEKCRITLIGRSQPKDALLMVEALKQKGCVVAFFGGLTTTDIPALKEADVGITDETQSTKMAREISGIVVPSHRGMNSFIPILNSGRCVYGNIQKFMQLVHTASASGLLITAVATMCLGESPITVIQLIWVNLVVYILGGLMMVMEIPTPPESIANQTPGSRTESLVTKVMWRNFVVQILYQVVGLLIFLLVGKPFLGINPKVQKAVIFNGFTLCQVFNLFNIMELAKKEVFKVVLHKYNWSLVVLGALMASQVLVVQYGRSLANYESLNWMQWTFCFLLAMLSWRHLWPRRCLWFSTGEVWELCELELDAMDFLFPTRNAVLGA